MDTKGKITIYDMFRQKGNSLTCSSKMYSNEGVERGLEESNLSLTE